MDHRLEKFFKKMPDVEAAFLFGSKASGRQTPLSDTDIAVLLKAASPRVNSLDYKLELLKELKKALKDDNIDLVILNSAPPLLKYQAARHGKTIYAANDAAPYHFKARAINEYLDIKPMLDFFTRDAVTKIRGA